MDQINQEKSPVTELAVRAQLLAAISKLKEAGLEDAHLASELLMAHVLKGCRETVFKEPQRVMSDTQRDRFQELIQKLVRHISIAIIFVYLKARHSPDFCQAP